MAKKPSSSADIAKIGQDLKNFLVKYNTTIFIVIILGTLAYSITSVNLIMSTESDAQYRLERQRALSNDQFNKKTIDQIQALRDRKTMTDPQLPSGRINPFW